MVMDFKLAVWQAAPLEFPDINLHGSIFDWTQSVWKRLLALPMIPEEHISQIFAYSAYDGVRLALVELLQYIETSGITCSTFSLFTRQPEQIMM